MQLKVKNVHRPVKILADGTVRAYAYAWRGGPCIATADATNKDQAQKRLSGYLASPEGLAKIVAAQGAMEAVSAPKRASVSFIDGIVSRYLESPEYANLSKRTRSDYEGHLGDFRSEFGDWRVSLFDRPAIAQDLSEWRDEHSSPRQGDMRIQVVGALFSWARSRGLTGARPADPVRKIYRSDRSDVVWTEGEIAILLAGAAPPLQNAIKLAVETGLRLGDLIRLPWSDVSDVRIRTLTSKRSRETVIPITKRLRAVIKDTPKLGPIVLTSRLQRPWTKDGLQSSFTRLKRRTGLTEKRWHDFRGTAVTRLAKSNLKSRDIARIMAWSEDRIEGILDKYVSEESIVKDMLDQME